MSNVNMQQSEYGRNVYTMLAHQGMTEYDIIREGQYLLSKLHPVHPSLINPVYIFVKFVDDTRRLQPVPVHVFKDTLISPPDEKPKNTLLLL